MMVIISGAEMALWKWKSSGGSCKMLKSVQYLLILGPLYKRPSLQLLTSASMNGKSHFHFSSNGRQGSHHKSLEMSR